MEVKVKLDGIHLFIHIKPWSSWQPYYLISQYLRLSLLLLHLKGLNVVIISAHFQMLQLICKDILSTVVSILPAPQCPQAALLQTDLLVLTCLKVLRSAVLLCHFFVKV